MEMSVPVGARMLLPLPQAHIRWDCWCLRRDGELPCEKQSNGSLQHPSLWHHLRKRVINSPELQEICFWHGFLAILLLSHPGCWQPKRQDFWGDAKGRGERLKTTIGDLNLQIRQHVAQGDQDVIPPVADQLATCLPKATVVDMPSDPWVLLPLPSQRLMTLGKLQLLLQALLLSGF